MELGQIGFEAYNASTGGKTFDGRDIPPWESVAAEKPHVAAAWGEAAWAIANATSIEARIRRSMTDEIKGGLGFGEALFALKTGHRVARAGWNGKSMWIALTPGSSIDPEHARVGAARLLSSQHVSREPIRIGAHIDMKAADGSLVIGWLASQTDMLAEDWTVVE